MPERRFAPLNNPKPSLNRLSQEREEITALLTRINQAIPETKKLSESGILFIKIPEKKERLKKIAYILKKNKRIIESAVIQIDLYLEFEQIGTKIMIKSPEKPQRTALQMPFEYNLPIAHWN